ncbi:Arc family DNA-binding protein [Rhizobium sp. BE258]|uniref:Arc family DNA-binding protein n=1 Tax=Rhizobium sp. BE258 TaxID=2817722 RepID=UPI00285D8BB3|nr:hypothetical protein [Rhizobium sp. BE258]
MKPASRGADQFVVRLPEGLRDQVKQSADRNLRSMNSEIIYHLQQAVQNDNRHYNEKGSVSA